MEGDGGRWRGMRLGYPPLPTTDRVSMDRRDFITRLGLATVALRSDAAERIRDAAQGIAHLSPEQAAQDEDFWFQVRHAFTIDRNQINLNSGSVSPAPRVVQEAVRQYDTIV